MAQYYDASEMSRKIQNQLKNINWESIEEGKSYMIEIPVHTYFNYQRLCLYIYPVDDGYYISDDGETFIEFSCDTKYYFDLFMEKDNNNHFEIKLENDHIHKKYKYDYSLVAALDEFIRFFIYLDDFMNKNNIV